MCAHFCILLLLVGPWIGPAWSATTLQLTHEREAQLLAVQADDQHAVANPRPADSHSGDQVISLILGKRPALPRPYPQQALTHGDLPHPTRRLLITVHASSFL
jgi:hypothetical protein